RSSSGRFVSGHRFSDAESRTPLPFLPSCLPHPAGLLFSQFISPGRISLTRFCSKGGCMGIAVSPIQIDSRVGDFIGQPRKMLIDGKWVNAASGKTFPTYNPATGEVLAQVAEGDRQDIDLAVKAARKAFDSGPWSRITAADRGKLV